MIQITMWRVRPKGEKTWCYCETRDDAIAAVGPESCEDGYDLESVTMSLSELEGMGEFDGW